MVLLKKLNNYYYTYLNLLSPKYFILCLYNFDVQCFQVYFSVAKAQLSSRISDLVTIALFAYFHSHFYQIIYFHQEIHIFSQPLTCLKIFSIHCHYLFR